MSYDREGRELKDNSMDNRALDGQPFTSKAEQTAAMKDIRYSKDSAYRARVIARMNVTDFKAVTGTRINEGAYPMSNLLPDDAQYNPNGPIHSVREAMEHFRNPLYKTDPYHRAVVAEAVRQSWTGAEPRTGDDMIRIQYDGVGEEKK